MVLIMLSQAHAHHAFECTQDGVSAGNKVGQHPKPVMHHEPVPKLNALERGMESAFSKISACFGSMGNNACCRALTNNPVSNLVLHVRPYFPLSAVRICLMIIWVCDGKS